MKKNNLPEINGATLLSKNEAKKLPKDIRESSTDSTDWWLRSPGSDADEAAFVRDGDGAVEDFGIHVWYTLGVRPALCISNLESSDLQVGDKFGFDGYSFTVISDEYALCDEIIGRSCFREDAKAEDADVYEASDVKKFVDSWYEKALEKDEEKALEEDEEREV